MGILNTIMKGLIGDGGQSEGLSGYAAALGNPNGTFSGASGSKGVGGLAGWVKDNSKLLSQYLAAAGMDAAEGGGLGKNFNGVTMQQNSSDSMTQLLTKLLGGGMPGVEAKIGDKGLSINVTRETPAGQPGPDPRTTGIAPIATPGQGATAPAAAPATPAQPQAAPQQGGVTLQSLFGGVRPFSADLSGVSASDLVGLSPELILQALQLDQGQEQINDQKYRDIVNAHYNMGMLDDAQKRTALSAQELPIKAQDSNTRYLNAISEWAKMGREAPMEVPGIGKLSLDEWDKLPVDTKAYSYYVFDAKRNGQEVMDFNSWKNQPTPPQIYEIYKLSTQDPDFAKFAFKWQKSGAASTTINMTPGERKVDEAKVSGQVYFMNPNWSDDLKEHLFEAEDTPQFREAVRGPDGKRSSQKVMVQKSLRAIAWMKDKITSGDTGGEIQSESWDPENPGVYVFRVKWRDGSVSPIKINVRSVSE